MTLKPWQRIGLTLLAVVAVFYGMVYVDVVLRARDAWMKGEMYWRWADHPEERLAYLQQQQAKEQTALDAKKAAGTLSADEYSRATELLQFRYAQMGRESSLKYAYVWYQTAAELFSPPESKWVVMARAKMPLAKERWKAELAAQHIPYDDYMLN